MSTLSDRWLALVAELGAALMTTDVKLVVDLGASVEGGQAVVGPPTFLFEGMCGPDEPTGISYSVFLCEAVGERAVERLLERLPSVLVALGEVGEETTVQSPVAPGAFPTGGSDLPCYVITAETTL